MKKKEFGIRELPPGSVLLMTMGDVQRRSGACPLHGSKFNVRPGAALEAPAKDPLKTHRATFDGEVGGVDVPPALTVRSE